MRIAGLILIIIGIVMMVTKGFHFSTKQKVAEVGPVEINKKENKTVTWPIYAGGGVMVVGLVLVLAGKKNKES